MQKTVPVLITICGLVLPGVLNAQTQESSPQTKLIGKWTQHYTGMSLPGATLNIMSVDAATGQLRGRWIPPAGAAGGKEFEVIGWVSSAPPREKLDNVITIAFTVSLTTYGSIVSYTGYFKDTASWFNIKPNSTYEWETTSLLARTSSPGIEWSLQLKRFGPGIHKAVRTVTSSK